MRLLQAPGVCLITASGPAPPAFGSLRPSSANPPGSTVGVYPDPDQAPPRAKIRNSDARLTEAHEDGWLGGITGYRSAVRLAEPTLAAMRSSQVEARQPVWMCRTTGRVRRDGAARPPPGD